MAHRIIELGSTPHGEPSAKVGWDDHKVLATLECRAFRDLILRTLGTEPPGCYLTIRGPQVVLIVLEEQDGTSEYIRRLNEGIPTSWDRKALGHVGRGLQRLGLLPWEIDDEDLGKNVRKAYETVQTNLRR